ncbi:MAG: hypothetical protein Q9169_008168 [Polycauliona sp. 2 TL-2023]
MDATVSQEPVALKERLVFRANVPIHAGHFLSMHQAYKDAETFINKSLAHETELTRMAREIFGEAVLDNPDEDEILLRCALREVHEARLQSQCQLSRVTGRDIRHLDLLEEVWKAHGVPNGSEMALLCGTTGHTLRYLAGWLGHKQRGSKAYAAIGRKMFPPDEAQLHLRYEKLVSPYLKKPHTRH